MINHYNKSFYDINPNMYQNNIKGTLNNKMMMNKINMMLNLSNESKFYEH